MFKKVETLEKDMKGIEKYMTEIKEMLKGKFMNTQFVEEEVIVDVKNMNAGAPITMLIDRGALKSVMSREWIE